MAHPKREEWQNKVFKHDYIKITVASISAITGIINMAILLFKVL